MITFHKMVLTSCALCFLVQCTNAQYIRIDQGTADRIDSIVTAIKNANNLTGVSVGIVYKGDVVYANGYGFKNDEFDPFTEYTKSLIASVSKTITGVMTMKMIQQGDLSLDDEVENYVTGFDNSGITIAHLLTHQSGIDHYNSCPDGYDGSFNWYASLINVQGCSFCVSPPGAGSLYTTQGFVLLGVILEIVGLDLYGMTFEDLYEDWIRDPAGLITLTPEHNGSDPSLAEGFEENGDLIGEIEDFGWKLPAGGFISNVIDLARYGAAVMDNAFMLPYWTDQMFTDQSQDGGEIVACNVDDANNANNYGFSWRVNSSGSRAWHNGLNSDGYSSLLFLYPNDDAAIALLCNNYDQTDVLSTIRIALHQDVLCPSTRDFSNAIDWFRPTEYQAGNIITGSSEVLSNGGNGEFLMDANRVVLEPGFLVKAGRTFQTMSAGCED